MVVKSDQGCVAAARPPDEAARRLALLGLNILDTPAEARFDQIIYLAKLTFGVPIAYIAFVDEERQWIKARIGMAAQENHRDISFCGHAILSDQIITWFSFAIEKSRYFAAAARQDVGETR